MDNKKSKILTIIAVVISLIGVFLFVNVLRASEPEAIDSAAGIFVGFSTWLLIITAAIALILSMWGLIKQPQALKKTLIGIAALGVLLVISYFIASDGAVTDAIGNVLKGGEAGSSTSKWVSTLINFTGILAVISLIAVGAGFVKSFK